MLEEGLIKLGLDCGDSVVSLLNRYMEEIELFNPAYGLVKVRDRQELIVKHILDSLAPINILRSLVNDKPHTVHIADLGSGAGLPGIPLAIYMNGAEFTLVERMGRRAGFLRNTLAVLGLPNIRLEETEMEKYARDHNRKKTFDMAIFRAFTALEPSLLRDIAKLLAPDGIIAAYKGRKNSVDEEMARFLEPVKWEVFPLEVPFLEEERHLLVIRPEIA